MPERPDRAGVGSGEASVLELVGLTKRFGGVTVIEDLSLTVTAQEAVGVIGPNGAGKTTMLNLIAGDVRPEHGEVRLAGRDVTGLRPDQRCRAGVGRTAQVPRPYRGMSVFENVLVAAVFGDGGSAPARSRSCSRPTPERIAAPRAASALERTGLISKANAQAGTLTLLELKRLELARALASQPTVLLLDEIAGGLTEAEVHELIGLVEEIRQEVEALVWIEHIVHALTAVVDRVVAIDFGRVIADGNAAAVIASPEVRRTYLGDAGPTITTLMDQARPA